VYKNFVAIAIEWIRKVVENVAWKTIPWHCGTYTSAIKDRKKETKL